jgi:hypothetical protein
MNNSGTVQGTAQSTGAKTSYSAPLNRRVVLWMGGITLAIILAILIFDVVTYFSKSVFYAKYKAQPVSSISGEAGATTKALGPESDYYYPNGRPDPETGLPPNSNPIPNGILNTIQSNLNNYKGISNNSDSGWGYIQNDRSFSG